MRTVPISRGWWTPLSSLGIAALLNMAGGDGVRAIEYPPCPPPTANEYLLLVRGDTEAQRTRVQDLLPSNSTVLVCDYLDDTVVRAGGFTSLENANAWAQYMTEVEGLQAFVARPATPAEQAAAPIITAPGSGTTPPAATSTPPTASSTPSAITPANGASNGAAASQQTATASTGRSYAPRALGAGFAVLVDYQNRPETAAEIQKSIGQAVGLAVYRQRPYLLIAHSPNVEGAASTISVLSSKSIPAFIVDSQGVMMLTNAVSVPAQ